MLTTKFDKTSKIWSGLKVPFPFAKNVTVGEVILKNLSKTPDRVTQISDDDGIELTCNELRLLSVRASQNLVNLGLEKGDIVGFMAKNSIYLTPVIFGSFLAGFAVNPLDPNYMKQDIAHMLQQTKPKLIFCDAEQLEKVEEALKEIKLNAKIYTLIEKVTGSHYVNEVLKETGCEDQFVVPDLGDSSELIAAVLGSSGTTGPPKGVIVTHASLMTNLVLEKNEEVDVAFHPGSITWISSFLIMVNAACSLKTRVISTKTISIETLVSLVVKHKITQFFAAAAQARMLAKSTAFQTADLSHVKILFISGAKTSLVTTEMLKKHLPNAAICVVYAMTEGGNAVSMAVDGSSSGKLFFNVTVKILDEEGNQLGVNEAGEIWVKFLMPFLGYYNNPKANENVIDADGFYATGDIGYFDGEGNLCLKDRKSDTMHYLNHKIYLSEIENFIQNIEGVSEVCAIAIPDEKLMTDLVTAMVIKTKDSQLKEVDVVTKVAMELQDHKHLRGGVFFVDNFPMTTSGKVVKHILIQTAKKMYQLKCK